MDPKWAAEVVSKWQALGPAPSAPDPKILVQGRDLIAPSPSGSVKCSCAEKKDIPVEEIKSGFSGVVPYTDNICDVCFRMCRGMAALVCLGCREVVQRVGPFRDASGFRVVAGGIYHVKECPSCSVKLRKELQDTGKVHFDLIERILFERERDKCH